MTVDCDPDLPPMSEGAALDALLDAVNAALLAWDPVHIGFVDDHEYEPEAKLILALLPEATSAIDVQRSVYAVFCHQFNEHGVGAIEDYASLADRIWADWQARESNQ